MALLRSSWYIIYAYTQKNSASEKNFSFDAEIYYILLYKLRHIGNSELFRRNCPALVLLPLLLVLDDLLP